MMQKLSPQRLDRIENIVIAVLVCTALLLVGKAGMFQAITSLGGSTDSAVSGSQGMEISCETPVGLMSRTDQGRCGVQYAQATVDDLYSRGLGDFLTQSLEAMGDPKTVTPEDWQAAVSEEGTWVCYDFLYNVSFGNQEDREGRLFMVRTEDDRASEVFYYNQDTGEYYTARVKGEEIVPPAVLDQMVPNGAKFAFEVADLTELLPGYMMILPSPPTCRVYQAWNPLELQDALLMEDLLVKLNFNTRAASVYESADGTVIREGADSLRIQKDGTVSFHGSGSGTARYQAQSQKQADLHIKAQEILGRILSCAPTQGRMRCQSVEALSDGSVQMTFCYMLGGAQVDLWQAGPSARFVFRGADLTSFSVRLRQYQETETACAILPELQAAAAAATMGQAGKELQLCYRDDGSSGLITAGWTVREQE